MPRQHRQAVLALRRATDLRTLLLIVVGLAVAAVVSSTFGGSGSAADDPATPNVVVPTGSPVPCGTPATSWGSATASDVRVQIRGVAHGVQLSATPTPTTPESSLTSIDLEIANLGNVDVRIEPENVTLHTCAGEEIHPVMQVQDDASTLPLGLFPPGASNAGTLLFEIPTGDQPRLITVEIQEEHRTGARVECDLVVALDIDTEVGEIAVGCSAFGGDAMP
ncbi:MAG: DUF4352 domain-containing protein, partial [Thermomicrobiales bacterium]